MVVCGKRVAKPFLATLSLDVLDVSEDTQTPRLLPSMRLLLANHEVARDGSLHIRVLRRAAASTSQGKRLRSARYIKPEIPLCLYE